MNLEPGIASARQICGFAAFQTMDNTPENRCELYAMLIHVQEGTLELIVDEQMHVLTQGQFCFIQSGVVHQFESMSALTIMSLHMELLSSATAQDDGALVIAPVEHVSPAIATHIQPSLAQFADINIPILLTPSRSEWMVKTLGQVMPKNAVRDAKRMGAPALGRTPIPNLPTDPVSVRLFQMMKGRQEEMAAVENLASVIYDQKHMPWEFYQDLARHLWDEVRHALFGQAALEAEGIDWMALRQYVGGYDPLDREAAGTAVRGA